MSWTEERVEKLKEYWAEGMSASQIAKQLGGVTRNAVIGKVHRLGLSNRAAESDPPQPAEPAQPAEAEEAQAEEAQAEPALAEPEAPTDPAPEAQPPRVPDADTPRAPGRPTPEEEAARVTLAEIEKMARKLDLLELTEQTCKWPIGDPAEDGFHFCGLPALDGKPYCEHHVAVAFQPMSTRRDRSRSR